MEFNTTLIVTLVLLGFICIIIPLIMAFRTLIRKKEKIHTDAWEEFLQRDSFSHLDIVQFSRNTLKQEMSFSNLHSKLLKPLVKEGKLKEETHSIPSIRGPRKILIYRRVH